jgi:hypothetical protein
MNIFTSRKKLRNEITRLNKEIVLTHADLRLREDQLTSVTEEADSLRNFQIFLSQQIPEFDSYVLDYMEKENV